MNCLFIDLGSTFIKWSVFNTEKYDFILQDKTEFPAANVNKGVCYRVSQAAIAEKIFDIFKKAKQYVPERAFISVQMHGYITRDKKGCFSDYVSWRDKSGNILNDIFDDVNFDDLGTSKKDNLPLTKTIEKGCEFFTLGSFLAYKLTGVNATHITDAGASGFFFCETGEGNSFSKAYTMPVVYTKIAPVGRYEGILIYTPAGDHQVSFLGSGAEKTAYLVNIGTATQVSCVDEKGYISGCCEKRPFFEKGKRLYTVSGLTGGEKADECKEALLYEINEALKILPKKNKIIFGGGGAAKVYEYLKSKLSIECVLSDKNIGMEGLKIMSKTIKSGVMHSEIPFVNFPIIAKNSGLDFIILDNEHGAFDYSVIEGITVTSNLINQELIVRIGNNTRDYITKLADIGVKGFLLPMTNSREDIENVVKYAKYVPVGKRGVSTTRAHTLYNPPKLTDYMKQANEKMKIYAQIETKSGMDNLEDILSVDGVDGVFIGPNDLSVDLECIGDKNKIFECIEKIGNTCKNAGKVWGIITGDKDYINCSVENGVDMISVGSELNMLINGCKKVKDMLN